MDKPRNAKHECVFEGYSGGLDEPVHPHKLVNVFAACLYIDTMDIKQL